MPRISTFKTVGSSWTADALLDQWRASLQEQDRSPGTVKKYTQALAHFLAWYEAQEQRPLAVTELTPIALIGYRNALQHDAQKAVSTINLRLVALRTWCAWLVEQGYLAHDPAARVKLVRSAQTAKRDGLTNAQVHALLRQAQLSGYAERNYAIVQILLQTGIRIAECSDLTLGDITLGERKGELLVRAGKGNKVRSVPLNASVRDVLAVYVAPRLGVASPTLKAVAAAWPQATEPLAFAPLFTSQKGGGLSASAIGQLLADLVRTAGTLVPQSTSAHTLRHTFARTYLTQFPGDIVGLATLLGHSSLETTRLYSQPSVEQLSARVEQLPLNAYAH